jgi:hypothetical protein
MAPVRTQFGAKLPESAGDGRGRARVLGRAGARPRQGARRRRGGKRRRGDAVLERLDDAALWGREIDDERYVVVSAR